MKGDNMPFLMVDNVYLYPNFPKYYSSIRNLWSRLIRDEYAHHLFHFTDLNGNPIDINSVSNRKLVDIVPAKVQRNGYTVSVTEPGTLIFREP